MPHKPPTQLPTNSSTFALQTKWLPFLDVCSDLSILFSHIGTGGTLWTEKVLVVYDPDLELLTEPLDGIETQQGAPECMEGLMDVVAPLIADREPPELPQPRQGPLDHPAMATQPLAGIHTLAGDADLDVALVQEAAAARDVVRLVSMQLDRTGAGAAAPPLDGRNAVDHGFEDGAVMTVRPAQLDGERGAASVRNKMALRARFAAIRRIRSSGG